MSIYRMATVDVPTYTETASDSYTKLLLHCDGTNGSTTITDKIGKTMTAYGNAKISTAQSKFRGASLSLDGSGDYISSPNSVDFRFGTGDFTIDFWLYSNVAWSSQPFSASICGQKKNDTTNGWVLYRDSNYPTKINARVGLQNSFPTGSTPTANVWEHWALVRNGTTLKWYKNGILDATTTSSVDVNDTTGLFLIGLADSWASSFLNGYVDELRISKGIARWTANFTPPTAPYDTTITQTPTNTNVEIKSQYRGLSGVNREIKEQYRGLGGVNRKVFSKKPALALYWQGDECIPLTGGWTPATGFNYHTETKEATALKMALPTSYSADSYSAFVTTNKISVLSGQTLNMAFDFTYTSGTDLQVVRLGLNNGKISNTGWTSNYINTGKFYSSTGSFTLSVPITVTESNYVMIVLLGNSAIVDLKATKVWLE